MNFEEFLRKKLAQEKITLIGKGGIEYTFDIHEPRSETKSFCFYNKNLGIIQFNYEKIRDWKVKEK